MQIDYILSQQANANKKSVLLLEKLQQVGPLTPMRKIWESFGGAGFRV